MIHSTYSTPLRYKDEGRQSHNEFKMVLASPLDCRFEVSSDSMLTIDEINIIINIDLTIIIKLSVILSNHKYWEDKKHSQIYTGTKALFSIVLFQWIWIEFFDWLSGWEKEMNDQDIGGMEKSIYLQRKATRDGWRITVSEFITEFTSCSLKLV